MNGTEPSLIIKSEDLKGDKLAFIKAIMGSKVFNPRHPYDFEQLLGVSTYSKFIITKLYNYSESSIQVADEIIIRISDLKIDPRLLIGENAELINRNGFYGKVVRYSVSKGWVHLDGWNCETQKEKIHLLRPHLGWLKQNFKTVGLL